MTKPASRAELEALLDATCSGSVANVTSALQRAAHGVIDRCLSSCESILLLPGKGRERNSLTIRAPQARSFRGERAP